MELLYSDWSRADFLFTHMLPLNYGIFLPFSKSASRGACISVLFLAKHTAYENTGSLISPCFSLSQDHRCFFWAISNHPITLSMQDVVGPTVWQIKGGSLRPYHYRSWVSARGPHGARKSSHRLCLSLSESPSRSYVSATPAAYPNKRALIVNYGVEMLII